MPLGVFINWMVSPAPTMRSASTRNIGQAPINPRNNPPAAGTLSLIMLNAIAFRAKAFISFSLGTIVVINAIRAGSWIVHAIPIRNTKPNKFQVAPKPTIMKMENVTISMA